jgi:hypothetical protein
MNNQDKKILIGTVGGLAVLIAGRESMRRYRIRKARKNRIASIKRTIEDTDAFLEYLRLQKLIEN